METAPLKRFAETARSSLIAQVGERLTQVLAIDSRARREHSDAVAQLEARIAADGQTAVLDAVAYTWFNRFCALRFMDVKRYTRAGVISPAAGHSQPEILAHAKLGDIDDSIITSAATREAVAALLSGKQTSDDHRRRPTACWWLPPVTIGTRRCPSCLRRSRTTPSC